MAFALALGYRHIHTAQMYGTATRRKWAPLSDPAHVVLAALRRNGMMLTAYSPLAKGRVNRHAALIAYGRTASQIALRWLIEQDGVAVIPKASNRTHMVENLAVLGFALDPEDHVAIDQLGSASGRVNDIPAWSPAWDTE